MNRSVRSICLAAVIAAVYAALTIAFQAISFGPVQFRVSEALTTLPVLFPEAVIGLSAGCLIANLIGGFGIWDVVFGTLATLLAAIFTRRLRARVYMAALPPVLFNGVIIGLVLRFTLAETLLLPTMLTVALGEAVVVYALGVPLIKALGKLSLK